MAILRTIKSYCLEWNTYHPSGTMGNDWGSQFCFLKDCFSRSIATGKDIPFTMDLNGQPFAQTADQTLRLTSDDVGLLLEADLVDSPLNRWLVAQIDGGKVRGWSHSSRPVFGGFRSRREGDITFTDHRAAILLEVCVVIRKVPRAKTRTTPVFLSGGPQGRN